MGAKITVDKFWSLVQKNERCWLWNGAMHNNGYGRVGQMYAHRYAYRLLVGDIPSGREIDHLCGNRRCVNPAHLEPVSHHENLLRGNSFSGVESRKTHCPAGHPYDLLNTYISKAGSRHCRTCHRNRAQQQSQARRAKRHAIKNN
jgi:HNH endonuclease